MKTLYNSLAAGQMQQHMRERTSLSFHTTTRSQAVDGTSLEALGRQLRHAQIGLPSVLQHYQVNCCSDMFFCVLCSDASPMSSAVPRNSAIFRRWSIFLRNGWWRLFSIRVYLSTTDVVLVLIQYFLFHSFC